MTTVFSTTSSKQKRPVGRRQKKIAQLLRQPGIHPVNMSMKIMFYVPAEVVDEADLLSSKVDNIEDELELQIATTPENSRLSRAGDFLSNSSGRKSTFSPLHRASTLGGSRKSRAQSRHHAPHSNSTANTHHLDDSQMPNAANAANAGKLSKATANSSYIHYEFRYPHATRVSKNDIVIHHNCGKVFLDGEMRNATWEKLNDEVVCGSWQHNFDVAVGSELIEDFYYKGIQVDIFDEKPFVSTRARFDRPKPGGPLPAQSSYDEALHPSIPIPNHLLDKPPSFRAVPPNTADGTHGARLNVDLRPLFAGHLETTSEISLISDTALKRILKARVLVTLDQPLLNDEQMAILNPLKVRFQRVEHLPRTPVPYNHLSETCYATFLKFQFFGDRRIDKCIMHETEHGATATFDHEHVVLTGLLPQVEFRNWLQHGNGFKIEVHDRDRSGEIRDTGPVKFGDRSDESISDGTASYNNLDSVGSALSSQVSKTGGMWDPYGVATLDLGGLLLGARKLKFSVPVLPCAKRDQLHFTSAGQKASAANFPGHYIDASTTLEATVELVYPQKFCELLEDGDLLVKSGVATVHEVRKRLRKATFRSGAIPPRRQMRAGILTQDLEGLGLEEDDENSRTTSSGMRGKPSDVRERPKSGSRGSLRLTPPSSALSRNDSSTSCTRTPATPPPHDAGRSTAQSEERAEIPPTAAREGEADISRDRPFARLVITCVSHFAVWLTNLRVLVQSVNARVLNLSRLHVSERRNALETYSLTREQSTNPDLPIITGVQIETPAMLMLILEAPNTVEDVLGSLVATMGWPDGANLSNFRTLMNSEIGFYHREYASFGLSIRRLTLESGIPEYLAKQELYFTGHPYHASLRVLQSLQQLPQLSKMRDVVRGDHFPRAADLVGLVRNFEAQEASGVPQEYNDDQLASAMEDASSISLGDHAGVELAREASLPTGDTTQGVSALGRQRSRGRRNSLPLDVRNPMFEARLASRRTQQQPNYVSSNRRRVSVISSENSRSPRRGSVVVTLQPNSTIRKTAYDGAHDSDFVNALRDPTRNDYRGEKGAGFMPAQRASTLRDAHARSSSEGLSYGKSAIAREASVSPTRTARSRSPLGSPHRSGQAMRSPSPSGRMKTFALTGDFGGSSFSHQRRSTLSPSALRRAGAGSRFVNANVPEEGNHGEGKKKTLASSQRKDSWGGLKTPSIPTRQHTVSLTNLQSSAMENAPHKATVMAQSVSHSSLQTLSHTHSGFKKPSFTSSSSSSPSSLQGAAKTAPLPPGAKQQVSEIRPSRASRHERRQNFDNSKTVRTSIHSPRISQIAADEPFEDSLVNRARMDFDRKPMSWRDRKKDFVAGRTRDGRPLSPKTIVASVFSEKDDELQAQADERAEWRRKIVVDDERFRVLRTHTSKAATDKFQDILRDPLNKPYKAPDLDRKSLLSSSISANYEEKKFKALTLGSGTARTGFHPVSQ